VERGEAGRVSPTGTILVGQLKAAKEGEKQLAIKGTIRISSTGRSTGRSRKKIQLRVLRDRKATNRKATNLRTLRAMNPPQREEPHPETTLKSAPTTPNVARVVTSSQMAHPCRRGCFSGGFPAVAAVA